MKHILPASLVSCFWLLASNFSFAIVDTNSNGVSDIWEKQFNDGNLFPSNFDLLADPDGDGWINETEAVSGTDPLDANQPNGFLRPVITHSPAVYGTDENGEPKVVTPEAVTITWPTVAGKQYSLLCSADLSPGSWLPVGEPETAYGGQAVGVVMLNHSGAGNSSSLLFRVAISDTDTDGDGFIDYEEHLLRMNPDIADRDGDGLSDEWEIANNLGLSDNGSVNFRFGPDGDPDGDNLVNLSEFWFGGNPNDPDTDNDFIGDWAEAMEYGTDIQTADSDYDGLSDGEEILASLPTDPNDPDSDDDTLIDGDEINLYHTNPLSKDTDGDMLQDNWEIRYFFNPLSISDGLTDPDGDGLLNPVEQLLKLNPRENDSNLDGVSDGNGDYDKDGLSNHSEVHIHHTNPKNPDTDRDGLPDGWEILLALDPNTISGDNGSAGDPDFDNLTNFAEWLNNTDPFKADSDNGGATDSAEVDQGTDPNDPDDDENPPSADDMISLPFTVSDPSLSHSEKWRMTIRGLDTEDQRSMSITSPGFGEQATGILKLLKGARYEVTVTHLDTDPRYLEENDDQPDYDWECTVDNKPTSESSESVGGRPGVNNFFVVGEHWIVDNRQAVFTTKKDGNDDDNVTGHVAILIPAIKRDADVADGDWQPVRGPLAKALPGQKINLGLNQTALPSGISFNNFEWILPNNVFKDYTANQTTAKLTQIETDDLDTDKVHFYFSNSGVKSVRLKCEMNGELTMFKTALKIEKPVATFARSMGTVDFSRGQPYLYAGLYPLAGQQGGIDFEGNVTLPSGWDHGRWNWVQLVTSQRTLTEIGGNTKAFSLNGQQALDTDYPYNPSPYTSHPGTAGGYPTTSQHTNSDSPAVLLSGYSGRTANDNFETFLMFVPAGEASRFVPLQKITWSWNVAVATNNEGYWNMISSGSQVSEAVEITNHPIWSINIRNGSYPP